MVKASVEEDWNGGCTYWTDLNTGGGYSRPVSGVWTYARAYDEQMAARINDFIQANGAPLLGIENQPAAWVIWLLVGQSTMSIVIQGIVFFGQTVRALFSSRWAVGGAYR